MYSVLYTLHCILHIAYCILYTLYSILHTVYCMLYIVYCVLYTVYCILCTVYCILYTVYSVLYTVYCILHTVYFVQYIAYSVLFAVYCVLILYTVFCVLYIVHCILHIAYCVLYIVYCTKLSTFRKENMLPFSRMQCSYSEGGSCLNTPVPTYQATRCHNIAVSTYLCRHESCTRWKGQLHALASIRTEYGAVCGRREPNCNARLFCCSVANCTKATAVWLFCVTPTEHSTRQAMYCTHDVTPWRLPVTQQSILCVLLVKIFSVYIRVFLWYIYGIFMSLATIQIIRTGFFERNAIPTAINHTSHTVTR